MKFTKEEFLRNAKMLIVMVVLLKKYHGALHNGQSEIVLLHLIILKNNELKQWQIGK
jgi:hypothetical protein